MTDSSWSTPLLVERSASTSWTVTPNSLNAGPASTNGVSAATMRSKPSFAASLAISRPIPLDAPVTTARLRELMAQLLLFLLGGGGLGLEDDLGVVVLVVVPVLVHLGRLLERGVVRDEEGRVDLPLLDHVEERPGIFLDMGLALLDRQALLHHLTEREFDGEGPDDQAGPDPC